MCDSVLLPLPVQPALSPSLKLSYRVSAILEYSTNLLWFVQKKNYLVWFDKIQRTYNSEHNSRVFAHDCRILKNECIHAKLVPELSTLFDSCRKTCFLYDANVDAATGGAGRRTYINYSLVFFCATVKDKKCNPFGDIHLQNLYINICDNYKHSLN